jgi:hypothetical protein
MDRSPDKREVPMFEVPSHHEALKLRLSEFQHEASPSSFRSRRLGRTALMLGAATCLILVAGAIVTAVWWPSVSKTPKKGPTVAKTEWYYPISREQDLAFLEKTHQKFASVSDATGSATAASVIRLYPDVREPKNTLGAKLLGVYVSKPGQVSVPDVTLRYSNGMSIVFTLQTLTPDYSAQCDYMKSLDARGYGSHTTYPYVTAVNGYQAMSLERGQNGDGSRYDSYVQWCANGTNCMVSSESLGTADLMKVANSMY